MERYLYIYLCAKNYHERFMCIYFSLPASGLYFLSWAIAGNYRSVGIALGEKLFPLNNFLITLYKTLPTPFLAQVLPVVHWQRHHW